MSYRIEIKAGDDKKSNEDNVQIGLQKLKKMMKKDGILSELRRREFYMTPSQKKKFRKNESLKRKRRDERKHEWFIKNKLQEKLDQ